MYIVAVSNIQNSDMYWHINIINTLPCREHSLQNIPSNSCLSRKSTVCQCNAHSQNHNIEIMATCLTSWTSSGFFLEIICVEEEEEEEEKENSGPREWMTLIVVLLVLLLVRLTQIWGGTQLWVWQWVHYIVGWRKSWAETSPTLLTSRVDERQTKRNSACPS